MEPRVFTRGNRHQAGHNCRCLASLQWSHASSRVEIRRGFEANRRHRRASMEPRVFTRGNQPTAYKWAISFGASMEPRVFTRGNESTDLRHNFAETRFNGATRLHAWK